MSPHLRGILRVCLAAPLLVLAGCGPGRNEFAPACPVARLVPALADLTRYTRAEGGHDLTDLVVQARIVKLDGVCQATDEPTVLAASVRITVSVLRGPAMLGRDVDMPVFVAVAEAESVRDKQVFPVHVVFPPNVDRLTITSPPIDLALPVGQGVTGAAYRIIAGFQLSPDELAANRHGGGG